MLDINATDTDVQLVFKHIECEWNLYCCLIRIILCFQDIPQQMNGSDCGMFACKFAEYITREAQINFTQVKEASLLHSQLRFNVQAQITLN